MAAAGRPEKWRPSSQREWEILTLGPSAARRAARARARRACEAGLRAALGAAACAPGSWRDRELASRPALQCRAEGRRVSGAARRRRNAAQHAARVPAGGFAHASDAGLALAAAGPRLEVCCAAASPPVVLAPGVWDAVGEADASAAKLPAADMDFDLETCGGEARAFAEGLASGWRLAVRAEAERCHQQEAEILLGALGMEPVAEEQSQASAAASVVKVSPPCPTMRDEVPHGGVDFKATAFFCSSSDSSMGDESDVMQDVLDEAEIAIPIVSAAGTGGPGVGLPLSSTDRPSWVPVGLPPDPGEGRLFQMTAHRYL